MAHRSLYDEALVRFKQDRAGTKDADLLKEFLRERSSPEQTKEAAEALQQDSSRKYGSKKLGGVEIPETWITNIMSNIESFIEAGDNLTEGAPESVGMAWFAVRLTLKAISSNYELYTCFGTGLSDISEIMVIVRHYDRLYDERSKKNFKATPMVEKLFQDVISVYAAVLDFSFAVKRHLTAGSLTRVKHGLKDFFGASNRKFGEKLETIATLKTKILEESQGVFQDKALTHLEGVSDALSGINKSVRDIRNFQDEQKRLHQEAMDMYASLTQGMLDLKNSTKPKTRWDWAVHDYQTFRETLDPLKGSDTILADTIDSIHPGTCQWIFEHDQFQHWNDIHAKKNMLVVTGEEGTGKSYLIASISQRITLGDGTSRELLYVNSSASSAVDAATALGDTSKTADAIFRTLLYDLYRLAVEGGEKNVATLEACNEVFKNARDQMMSMPNQSQDPKKGLPTFVDGFSQLAALIKRDLVLAIDNINKITLDRKNQEYLLRKLRAVSEAIFKAGASHVQIVVGCSSSTALYQDAEAANDCCLMEVAEGNRKDLGLVVTAALKEVPGLSALERVEAKEAILEKAQSSFRYVFTSAIPFMCEPFQRPLSTRLAALPGGLGDNYAQAVRKLSPNYVGLLRSALTWVLLAPKGHLSVREVMDAYQGTYDTIEEEHQTDEENPKFPEVSRLEIQQLQDATESILRITKGGQQEFMVSAPDLDSLSSFFFRSALDHQEEEEEEEELLCARCKAAHPKTTNLLIDPKEAHLQIALTCLRHLNNPVFQKRAGLVFKPSSDGQEKQPPHQGLTDEEMAEIQAQLEAGIAEEDSVDEEDGVENETYDIGRDFISAEREIKEEDEARPGVRYEVQRWAYHLRQAEALWSKEEIESSRTWAALMEELDKFTSSENTFSAWQKKYVDESASDLNGCFTISHGPHKALHVAAYLGLMSWAQHLVGNGADVEEASEGYRPLHAAAANEDGLDMMRFLLAKGADVNAKDMAGRDVLSSWLVHGRPSVEEVQLLLDSGADPTSTDDTTHLSSMHYYAIRGENTQVFQLLLDKGADINNVDPAMWEKFPPLHMLLMFRQKLPCELLQFFVDNGANVNSEDALSCRPLTFVSAWGQAENLEILLKAGIEDIDDPDTEGSSALQNAVYKNHHQCVRLLLQGGADPECADSLNRTSLHTAVRRGHMECAKVLFEHGCNINPVDIHGWTPFFCALLSRGEGSHEAANFILDSLIQQNMPLKEINKPSRSGRTAVRQAAARGFDDVISKLVQLASSQSAFQDLLINTPDTKKGMTPLHRAARSGHLLCVRLLLQHGADPEVLDSQSKTPLILAYEQWTIHPSPPSTSGSSYEEIISCLIDSSPGPRLAASDPELAAACAANGSVSLLRKLSSLNADLSRPDRYGWTPLELARGNPAAEAFLKLEQENTWRNQVPTSWSATFPGASASAAKSVVQDAAEAPGPGGQQGEGGGGTKAMIVHKSGSKKVCISADRPLPPRLERYYFEVTLKEVPKTDEEKKKEKKAAGDEGEEEEGVVHRPPRMAIGFATAPGTAVRESPAELGGSTKHDGAVKVWSYHSSGVLSSPLENDGDDEDTIRKARENGSQEFWEHYLRAYDVGDTVGVGVDLAKGDVWATRNGERLDKKLSLGIGNAASQEGGNRWRLWPIVGLAEEGVCFETNFGSRADGVGRREFKWKWDGVGAGG